MSGQFIGVYRVLRKLGAGGMGEVYLADDDRLGRRVALKCPSERWLGAADARARLQREARAAARLTHPNIASVYDVLEEAGRPYIVMEYVDGESLSTVASRGPVPPERAVDIGVQLADALAAAHDGGVVHRDLKPGNVMVTADGRIKVLDFGLATIAEPGSAVTGLTTPGQVLGTPGYVAPEQMFGQPADARSDIFAVGAILYELLTGRPPAAASGDGKARGLAALMQPARPIASVMPSLAAPLAALVTRAMAQAPADRFQTADDLKRALQDAGSALRDVPTGVVAAVPRRRLPGWAVASAVVVFVVAAGIPVARWWRGSPASPAISTTPQPPVVAVLPLDNLSGDPSLQYVGAGLAETMSTRLASVSGLSVISRGEIHEALQRTRDASAVARALGAAYVVTGGVQQAAGRLQVTINLLSPDGRRIISGSIYEDSEQHLFALQRRIAEELTERIVGSVSAADRERLARDPTSSVQAMAASWRGRALLEQPGPDPIDPAIAALEEATRTDPSFALGEAGLAGAYWRKYVQTHDRVWAGRALDTAARAAALDPNQPEVRLALATVYRGSGRDAEAIRELDTVIALRPGSYDAYRLRGEIRADAGRIDEALADLRSAIGIRRDYWLTYRSIGVLLMRVGRYGEAEPAFRRVVELQPESPIGYQLLGTLHATMVDLPAATRDYERAMARGGSFGTYSALGTVYYWQGRFDDAVRMYTEAIERRPKSAVTHWNLGDAYRQAGHAPDAERAYRDAVALFDADLGVNPRDALARATRATCLARLGQVEAAVAEVGEANVSAPADPDVQYQRALVLMLAGRPDAAVDAVAQAVESGYSVPLLRLDIDLAPLRRSERFRSLTAVPATAGSAK